MIRIKIDDKQFQREIKNLTDSMKSIPQAQNTSNIARATGSIAAKEFIKSLNKAARSNPSEFHHLYEWKEVGRDKSRLVTAKRKVSGGSIEVELIFKKSKKKVPISKILTQRNKRGKSVVSSSIFKNKAEVMEKGISVKRIAKKNVVFLDRESNTLVFRNKGTIFNISNPGGRATINSLGRYAKKWENGMAQSAINKSKIFEKIEKDIAKTLSMPNPSSIEIRNCIKNVCDSYDIKGEI